MENRINKNPIIIGLAAIIFLLLGWYWLPFIFIPFALFFHLKKILDARENIYQFSFIIFFCIAISIISIKVIEGTVSWFTLIQAFTLPFAFIVFGILDVKLPNRFSYSL
jgi:hypothetical protein